MHTVKPRNISLCCTKWDTLDDILAGLVKRSISNYTVTARGAVHIHPLVDFLPFLHSSNMQ